MSNLTTRVAALESDMAEVKAGVKAILHALTAQAPAPAEVTAPIVQGEVVPTAPKAVEAKQPNKFAVLRVALKAHKAAKLIPAGVTVREAIAQGLMDEDGNCLAIDAPVAAPVVTPTVVVTEAKPAQAAKPLTEAQVAHREAPRRANGTCPPKREWALREQLAMTGKFDRHEIDAKVAEAYDNPALAETFGLNA